MPARDYLLLWLEAPLMAFGGPMVDQIGPTRAFPGASLITGLLGNALGLAHGDAAALEALQARLRLAALAVRPGEMLRDYHTVDLGRPHLQGRGWTTRGQVEGRAGASSDGTHIRHRWYLADAAVLVALTLDPPDAAPDLEELTEALAHPARPLFLGRKTCLPTAPLLLVPVVTADTPQAALRAGLGKAPCHAVATARAEVDARLMDDPPHPAEAESEWLVDRRDWHNQLHTGTRLVHRFTLGAAP